VVAVALGLGLLIVVLWLLGRDGAVEETTVPTTLAAPTTTAVTTTTAVRGIVAAPIPAEDASLWSDGPLVAVSAGEAWTVMSTPEGDLIGHLEDGAWTFWHITASEEEESGLVRFYLMRGLAVAPDGAVWAATERGVFSFDGVEWTRRFDDPATAVAIDEGGTVWISGSLYLAGRWGESWLARWDGESWERVRWPPGASPESGGWVAMAALPGGEVWVTVRSWGCDTGPLMHYDGTTLEAVQVTDRPFLLGGSYAFEVEAAPNGDLWVGGFLGGNPGAVGMETWTEPPVLARFDGEGWTVYDSPPYDPTGGCHNTLLDLAVGPDGVVWWASGSSLASFDGTEWTTHIEGRWVHSVDVAPDGTVWYADEYGIHAAFPAVVAAPGPADYGGVLAVSAREMWAVMGDLLCRLQISLPRECYTLTEYGWVWGLAVTPDGTVWAATSSGVFSFDGGVWTRRLAAPAGGVAVTPDGAVLIGGPTPGGRLWLARWDGESWVRVGLGSNPEWGPRGDWNLAPMAVLPDGQVWVSAYTNMGQPLLMRYDGTTMEQVQIGRYPMGTVQVEVIKAAPNGDVWILGTTGDFGQPVFARFDGAAWKLDWPWADPNSDLASRLGPLHSLAVGPDGVVWVGGEGGLASFDGTDWTVLIEGRGVFSLDVAPDGTLWYADDYGIHTLGLP